MQWLPQRISSTLRSCGAAIGHRDRQLHASKSEGSGWNCLFLTTDGLSFDLNRLKPRKNRLVRHLALIEVPPQTIGMPSQAVGMDSQGVEVPAQVTDMPPQATDLPSQTTDLAPQAADVPS